MAKKRKKKNGENAVREWISDNLRYLLLILVVVIAALVAFLIYRQVSGSRSAEVPATAETTAETVSETSAEPEAAAEETPAPTEEPVTTTTEVVTATPTETPTPTPTPMPEITLTEMVPAATETVQNFFYEMQAGGNDYVEYYDSIHVQTCPGPTEGTYIAYADYDCKYLYYDALVPGLMEFYLAPDAEGQLRDVSEIPADVQAYIANVRQSDDVKALIEEVGAKYEEVMSQNPDLEEYLSGLE